MDARWDLNETDDEDDDEFDDYESRQPPSFSRACQAQGQAAALQKPAAAAGTSSISPFSFASGSPFANPRTAFNPPPSSIHHHPSSSAHHQPSAFISHPPSSAWAVHSFASGMHAAASASHASAAGAASSHDDGDGDAHSIHSAVPPMDEAMVDVVE